MSEPLIISTTTTPMSAAPANSTNALCYFKGETETDQLASVEAFAKTMAESGDSAADLYAIVPHIFRNIGVNGGENVINFLLGDTNQLFLNGVDLTMVGGESIVPEGETLFDAIVEVGEALAGAI